MIECPLCQAAVRNGSCANCSITVRRLAPDETADPELQAIRENIRRRRAAEMPAPKPRRPRPGSRRAKLLQRNVEIIALHAKGATQDELAAKFDVTPARIWQILSGYSGPGSTRANGAEVDEERQAASCPPSA